MIIRIFPLVLDAITKKVPISGNASENCTTKLHIFKITMQPENCTTKLHIFKITMQPINDCNIYWWLVENDLTGFFGFLPQILGGGRDLQMILVILSMQVQWWGYHEVVRALTPYLL